jgi:hypothetical protein
MIEGVCRTLASKVWGLEMGGMTSTSSLRAGSSMDVRQELVVDEIESEGGSPLLQQRE